MRYCALDNICYALLDAKAPAGCVMLDAPFAPLVALITRDPAESEASFAAACAADLADRGVRRLLASDLTLDDPSFAEHLEQHGILCVNTAFPDALRRARPFIPGQTGLRLHLAGLGDVGATLLSGLMLLGDAFDKIGIFDPDERRCRRCEMEAGQILSPTGHRPRVDVLSADTLFDCDLFVFAASAGVPPLGSAGDVRLQQLEANRAILAPYARQARDSQYGGLFFLVSDPVDLLCRDLFTLSNTVPSGMADYRGLRPEQVLGLGLGVMLARADYAAKQRGIADFLAQGRAYGPHGNGLVVANATGEAYDDALSRELSEAAQTAHLTIRDTGYKPYIAPALSSACTQIVRAVTGESFDAAIPLDGVYMGCRARLTGNGLLTERAPLPPALLARVQKSYDWLKEYGRL